MRKRPKIYRTFRPDFTNKFCGAVVAFRIYLQEVPGSKLGRGSDFFSDICSRKAKAGPGHIFAIHIEDIFSIDCIIIQHTAISGMFWY